MEKIRELLLAKIRFAEKINNISSKNRNTYGDKFFNRKQFYPQRLKPLQSSVHGF